PRPTVTPIDSSPSPTSTSNPSSSTTFSLTLCPRGLSNYDDNANPNSGDNTNPLHPPGSVNYCWADLLWRRSISLAHWLCSRDSLQRWAIWLSLSFIAATPLRLPLHDGTSPLVLARLLP